MPPPGLGTWLPDPPSTYFSGSASIPPFTGSTTFPSSIKLAQDAILLPNVPQNKNSDEVSPSIRVKAGNPKETLSPMLPP